MADLAIAWDQVAGVGDLCVDGADLVSEEGLRTAVVVSLFTDRRAGAEELPAGDSDRRGWWGDQVGEAPDEIGSLLWLLERAKLTAETMALAERYSEEALEWMVEDGVAVAIGVEAERDGRERMDLRVAVTSASREVVEFQFSDVFGVG